MAKKKIIQTLKRENLADDLIELYCQMLAADIRSMLGAPYHADLRRALEKLFADEKFMNDIRKQRARERRFFYDLFKSNTEYHRAVDYMIQKGWIVETVKRDEALLKHFGRGDHYDGELGRRYEITHETKITLLVGFIKYLSREGFYNCTPTAKQIDLILCASFATNKSYIATVRSKADLKLTFNDYKKFKSF